MKKIFLLVIFSFSLSFLAAGEASAKVQTKTIDYSYSGKTLKGYLAWDDVYTTKRPGILVVHEFWGLNDYAKRRAEQLASLGYVAFAADMYGDGRVTKHPEEATEMMNTVRKNTKLWMGRANAALKVLKEQPLVDADKVAAIGYCFGGGTVLQLAYTGADVKAVVSFHGALVIPKDKNDTKKIKAKILILHGANDSFTPPEAIEELKHKLNEGAVDYQFISYPNAVHSFTVKEAGTDPKKGIAYNAQADKKSWKEMLRLFKKVF